MNVSEAIIAVRHRINDRDEVGLDNEEILSYLNSAIQYICQALATANAPVLVDDLTINSATATLPKNFIKLAGIFPTKITGNTIKLLDTPPQTIRYFTAYGWPDMNGEMPFEQDALNEVAVQMAAIYANNQQELDVSQDKALFGEFTTAILAAAGIGGNGA
jgi:hypothetical protein